MSRFIDAATERLTLPNGDWLKVRRRLSAGEQSDCYERMYLREADGSYATRKDGTLIVSPGAARFELVTAYLIDWSITGPDGEVVNVRGLHPQDVGAVLRNLYAQDFSEIHAAVDAHDTRMARERAAQKKTDPGAPASSATSSSPNDSGSATRPSAPSTSMSTTSPSPC